MDVRELFEQHRQAIDQAKAFLCLCDYEQAKFQLYFAYLTNRKLLELVDAMKLEARTAERPAGEFSGGPQL